MSRPNRNVVTVRGGRGGGSGSTTGEIRAGEGGWSATFAVGVREWKAVLGRNPTWTGSGRNGWEEGGAGYRKSRCRCTRLIGSRLGCGAMTPQAHPRRGPLSGSVPRSIYIYHIIDNAQVYLYMIPSYVLCWDDVVECLAELAGVACIGCQGPGVLTFLMWRTITVFVYARQWKLRTFFSTSIFVVSYIFLLY